MWKGEFYKIIWKYREIFNKGFFFTKVQDTFTFNVCSKNTKGGLFQQFQGNDFQGNKWKRGTNRPERFRNIVCTNAYQSFYHFMFWRYDKISINSGHQGASKYSIPSFSFVHSRFFICSSKSQKRNFTIVVKSFCEISREIFPPPYISRRYNYFR